MGVSAVAHNCPLLTDIDLSCCDKVTDVAVSAIADTPISVIREQEERLIIFNNGQLFPIADMPISVISLVAMQLLI